MEMEGGELFRLLGCPDSEELHNFSIPLFPYPKTSGKKAFLTELM
jgi:hypothetical protein